MMVVMVEVLVLVAVVVVWKVAATSIKIDKIIQYLIQQFLFEILYLQGSFYDTYFYSYSSNSPKLIYFTQNTLIIPYTSIIPSYPIYPALLIYPHVPNYSIVHFYTNYPILSQLP